MLKSQCRFVTSFVWIFFFLDKKERLGRWKHLWKCMTVWLCCSSVLEFYIRSFLGQMSPCCTKCNLRKRHFCSPQTDEKRLCNHFTNESQQSPGELWTDTYLKSFPPMPTSFDSVLPCQNWEYENNGIPKEEVAAWKKKCRQRNTGTIFTFFKFIRRPYVLINVLICSFFWWKLVFREKII